MARPLKNNADYFPHDADMRNDPRIKALRRKFGMEGYAVYAMMLELLTDSDFFEFKNDSLSMELVAGDFDIETDKLCEILRYCFQLDLFQLDAETNVISCKSLDNRLEPLLSKRKRDRNEVIASDNTQSKVKESKGNESKVKETKGEENKVNETADAEVIVWPSFDDFWNAYGKKIDRSKCEKKWAKLTQGAREKIMEAVPEYVDSTPDIQYRRHPATYLNNNSWENQIIKPNGKSNSGNRKEQHDNDLTESVREHYRKKLVERGLEKPGS